MTLLEVERKMAAAVMTPLTTGYQMRKRTTAGGSMQAEAESFIKPNRGLSSFERLEIYNRQYWFRILSAFSEDFPALEALLGKRRFEALAKAYLAANPSRSFTLRNLGSELESWLRANRRWAGAEHAVAIDVARLEWAYIEAFDGGQRPPLTPGDAARISMDSLLPLQPHVRLLSLAFAVDDFIIDVHRKQVSASAASNAFSGVEGGSRKRRPGSIARKRIFLAVHRFDDLVYYKRLPPEAYRLLESLASPVSLGAALERAFKNSSISSSDQAARVQEWFASWAELGWFCREESAGKKWNRRHRPQTWPRGMSR